MERAEWLKDMRAKAQALYDHFATLYWVKIGTHLSETHARFLVKFLGRVPPHSTLLSAGFGDWVVPFFYNITLGGFRASVLGWLFLGGLIALGQIYNCPQESTGTVAPEAAV